MKCRVLIALSIANWCFIRIWMKILDPWFVYKFEAPPTSAFLATAFSVFFWGAIFFGAYVAAVHQQRPIIMHLFGRIFVLVIIGMAVVNVPFARALLVHHPWLSGCALLPAISAVLYWARPAIMVAKTVALITFPLLVLFCGQASVLAYKVSRPGAYRDRPSTARLPNTHPDRRVLWIVFDELDRRVVFDARPKSVKMPNFDRLSAESLTGTSTYSPTGSTNWSMPILITGRLFSHVEPIGTSDLLVIAAGTRDQLTLSPTTFSKAREMGLNAAVVGSAVPYCRILGDQVEHCSTSLLDAPRFRDSILSPWQDLAQRIPQLSKVLRLDLSRKDRESDARHFRLLYSDTMRVVADPSMNLVFLHLPVPHPPGIYNRFAGEMSADSDRTYLDNLALCDRTLGEIRQRLEAAGLWDSTTVLVTGDHWWRASMYRKISAWHEEEECASRPGADRDHRVVFLLKLAGQAEHVEYTPVLNNIVSHDLVLAILRGEVLSNETLAEWLNQHRVVGTTPFP